jgi:hypothetical protein
MPNPKPYQFTRGLTTRQECKEWLDYFSKKGIPAAIIMKDRHPPFSVWRIGMEYGEEVQKSRITHELTLVEAVNGFEETFNPLLKEAKDGRGVYKVTDHTEGRAWPPAGVEVACVP